jgi:hypothetical protein
MRAVVGALLVASLVAGCDDDGQKYTRSDVERAFRSQGFELAAPNPALVFEREAVLAPTTDEPFGVVIYENEKRATDAVGTLRSQATAETLDLQKSNVVVFSDEGVTPSVRKRIRDALAQLP